MDINEIEKRLDSFNDSTRLEALCLLRKKIDNNEIARPKITNFTNLHCHSFFSFNAYGYSPSHIAWRAFKEGLEITGIVDFDVLDGVEEMLQAGKILGIKTVAGIETRVFIEEYKNKIINSPNEPGIYYLMGTGFYKKPDRDSKADKVLAKMRAIARERNIRIVDRINNFLGEVKIDYEKDVLSLTPRGNATKRHILCALGERAIPLELMKCENFFPALEEVIDMIKDTNALPAAAWLDGTNEGEKDIEELLLFLIKKGIVVLNIIPERNWNIKDKKEKALKLKNLDEVIKTARKLNLPIIAGTEMNKPGQRFVDDFNTPELRPYLSTFRDGASFVYRHTQKNIL